MDGEVVVGRVVDPGSVVPGSFLDAGPAALAATSLPGGRDGGVLVDGVVAERAPGDSPPIAGDEPAAGSAGAVVEVDRFRAWLAGVDVAGLSDRERVELVAGLERVKGCASAAQAWATDALRCSREVVAPQDVARSVGSVVALARKESPRLGDRFVGLSRALVHEMPHTMAALTDGGISERVAVAVVAGTATLSREDRAEVDRRLGPVITRLGVKQAGRAATRVAAELDAASVVARMEAAVKSRRVTVRPAPDGMAYLSVLGPLKDVVGAHAALQVRARGVVGGQCPEEAPEGRGVGAVAADTALRLLSGRATGQLTPVEVHLVMTDRALLGSGDPDRSPFEPARIPGHGSVPAPVARAWLREGLGEPPPSTPGTPSRTANGATAPHARGAAPANAHDARRAAAVDSPDADRAIGTIGAEGSPGVGGAGGADSVARVWLRRLYASPDGRDLVAMDSRRRLFGGLLRRMLVLRDDVCTTPWCEAPIVHADHTTPAREGGPTSFTQGAGKCARCNHGKEAPGWRTRVVLTRGEPDRDRSVAAAGREGDPGGLGARRVVQVSTPLGHRYESEPPPLLGWGSRTFPPTRALPGMTGEPPVTSDAPVGPSPSSALEEPPPTSGAPVVPIVPIVSGVPEATPVTSEEPVGRRLSSGGTEPEQKPTPMRRLGHRRPEQGSGWQPGQRRKRALRRARTLPGSGPGRLHPQRRPRLTSHLERELCRYLT